VQKKLTAAFILIMVLSLCFTVISWGCDCKPTIVSIVKNSAMNTEQVTVTITGTHFQKRASVKLTRSGEEIVATHVKVISHTNLTCDFDLRGKSAGQWDVVVKVCYDQAVLAGGFTIIAPQPTPVPTPVPTPMPTPVPTPMPTPVPTPVPIPTLRPIFFDFDKSNIRPDQVDTVNYDLNVVLEYLKANPNGYIMLGGHTDERGSHDYNIQLALRRADTILQYFVAHGVGADHLKVYSFGKETPIVWDTPKRFGRTTGMSMSAF